MPTLEELCKTVTEAKSGTEKLISEFQKTHDALRSSVVQQGEEIKSFGTTSSETAKRVQDLTERFEKLHGELSQEMQKGLASLEESKKRQDELEAQLKRGGMSSHGGRKSNGVSPGQAFTDSESYKKFHEDRNPRTEKIGVGTFWSGGSKAGVSGGADLRFMFSQYFDPEIYTLHSEELRDQHIRDYLTINRNAPSIVNFIRETNVLNNADFQIPVADGNNANLKPLSEYSFEKESAQAATIAHGTPITRQLASDAPNLINHINGRLRQGLFTKEDLVILFQAYAPGKVTGITQTDGVQKFTRGQAGDTKIDNFRRALTQLQIKGYLGNLGILSPEDWEEIELEKDDNKRYVWTLLSVPGFQEPILWRVPIFVTTAQTEGKFMVGDFKSGCTLWEHKEAFVQIFDQHADWALRNQLLILAEEEIIFTVEQPEAFVDGEFGKVGS